MDYSYYTELNDYDYEMEQLQERMFYDWKQEFWSCMMPHTNQIFTLVGMLTCAVFCCRFGWIGAQRMFPHIDWLPHLVSFICGVALVLGMDVWNLVILLAFCGFGYICLRILDGCDFKCRNIGFILTLMCIITTIAFEFALNDPSLMQAVRSYIMICSMKLISLGFDLEKIGSSKSFKDARVPNLIAYLGYIFYPCTVMSGPWISYMIYEQATQPSKWGPARRKAVLWFVLCLAISFASFNFSNCVVPKLFINYDFPLLQAYRDAVSVRCDHYFILFLAQAGCALNGVFPYKTKQPNGYLGFMLTNPLRIEFPRSLAVVVRNWNIPMHDFLKEYIYSDIYKHLKNNYFAATVVTFMMSALMHGFYLKIYIVLMSLVFFSYVEFKLREKLAKKLDFCITANPCTLMGECKFRHCPNYGRNICKKWIAKMINLMFTLADIVCLAYLGVMMCQGEMSPDEMHDLSPKKGWQRWEEMHYGAHWGALVLYIVYLVS